MSEWILLKNLASAKAVTGFINSDGWKLNPAIENHDLDPLTSFPKKSTPISKKTINKYIMLPYLKYIFISGIIHKKNVKIHIEKKNNCLPKKLSNEKKIFSSKYVVE